jgi:hypothetical protein
MPSAGFEPAIPATKRPQTYALDRAACDRLYGIVANIKFSAQSDLPNNSIYYCALPYFLEYSAPQNNLLTAFSKTKKLKMS